MRPVDELRRPEGMTQEDLAALTARLGKPYVPVSVSTVSNWERGVKRPHRKTLESIQQAIRVWLGETDDAAPDVTEARVSITITGPSGVEVSAVVDASQTLDVAQVYAHLLAEHRRLSRRQA